jgi:hypothetical protein
MMRVDARTAVRWCVERVFRRAVHPGLGEMDGAARLQTTNAARFVAAIGIGAASFSAHRAELETDLRANPYLLSGGAYSGRWDVGRGEAAVLYSIMRSRTPGRIVETGVANGFSSYTILCAIRRNGSGSLRSYDPGRDVGGLVPAGLREGRWDLVCGKLDRPEPMDVFFHDSLHTYANQRKEYRIAWPCLPPGGLLLADDADSSWALIDFCASVGVPPLVLVGDRTVLGAVVKPPIGGA